MGIRVNIANEEAEEEWESFINSEGCSHHAYSFCWREILQSSFGHKPYYLIARALTGGKPGEIVGVAPLFYINSMLFGRALISVPYLNAGGILTQNESAYSALLNECLIISRELRATFTELRHRDKIFYPSISTLLFERTHKVSMELQLKDDVEALRAEFPSKLRAQIKRPEKSDIRVLVSGENLDVQHSVLAFYRVFSEHMRDLGTPVYPKKLFSLTAEHFQKNIRIITLWQENTPIAAGFTIGKNGTVEIPWAATLKRFHPLAPNMLLYWSCIRQACLDGYQTFDFGRSSADSGSYRFKAQWGATPRQLHWYYHTETGAIPDISPNNPAFVYFVDWWKRMPLILSNTLGPFISRGLP